MFQGGLTDSEYLSVQGNVTHLGIKKRIAPTNAYHRSDFLTHHDGPAYVPHNSVGNQFSTLHTLKRPASAIDLVKSEQELLAAEMKMRRKESEAKLRAEQCIVRDQRTGFNLITGEAVGNGPKSTRPHTRHIASGLGEESRHRGLQTMLDSGNRYFTPQNSGPSHWQRQQRLITDGLSHRKMAGVIKVGVAESPSNGIEDQFSRSGYMQRSAPLPGTFLLLLFLIYIH